MIASPVQARFTHPTHTVAVLGIEPGMTIADMGAGSGVFALAAAEALQGSGHVYALDVQRDLLRRLHNEATRKKLSVLTTIWADLEYAGSSKIADDYIDVVFISNVLFQVEDKLALLREAARIARPKGRVVIVDWSADAPGRHLGPHTAHLHSRSEAKALAGEVGLAYVREFDAGSHHYGLVFQK